MIETDVAGVGLNSTDTLLLVPAYPACGGKARVTREAVCPGGQVATALAACAALGLRTRYIGAVGGDERGRQQLASLAAIGTDLRFVQHRAQLPNQSAYIVVDQATRERTIFWQRSGELCIDAGAIDAGQIAGARLLHLDGHDTVAAWRAATLARELGIPVSADVDTIYPGLDRVLPLVDYLVSSAGFPARWTGEADPYRAIEKLQTEFGMRVAAMTLGGGGVLARSGGRFVYVPAFEVDVLDSTGAGDVFHGAFCYAVVRKMALGEALEFSSAMAALNCTALGARAGIQGLDPVRALMASGRRRPVPAWVRGGEAAE